MTTYSLLSCPTPLGLWPSGVQEMGRTLLDHGLAQRLGAPLTGTVQPGPYLRERDATTGYLNGPAIRAQSLLLADLVAAERAAGRVPVVLGGDCSVVIGPLLALRRAGNLGLFYLDGHQDYYDATPDHSGEVADMTLGIATGAAHGLLSDIDGLAPYVQPARTVAFGFRDEAEVAQSHARSLHGSGIAGFGLTHLRRTGLDACLARALATLTEASFWLHFDTDVVDDSLNPAVDYRLPGGLGWDEVAQTLRAARDSGRMAGLSVSIFNPRKDPDGRIAMALTECLVSGLRG